MNASVTEAPTQPGARVDRPQEPGAIRIHTSIEPSAGAVPVMEREIALELLGVSCWYGSFQVVRDVGRVPVADLERTLNMGIGFVAVLPEAQADLAIATLKAHAIEAWQLGQVSDLATASVQDGVEVVRGAKGVDGGSVQMVGSPAR